MKTTCPHEGDRLDRQFRFILEIDKLKHVFRRTYLLDGSRRENDAEHSWHISLMAVLLCQHAAEGIDVLRVVKMLLVHDLVEIDAGDTFCYDEAGNRTKAAREQAAADRVFNILPDDQARELRELWDEFEARDTSDAKFAAALDRLQPLLHNLNTQGRAWREHGITLDKVIARNKHIADGSPALWNCVEPLIRNAVGKGHLAE
jgi:putative hydrolase of HD superfamily